MGPGGWEIARAYPVRQRRSDPKDAVRTPAPAAACGGLRHARGCNEIGNLNFAGGSAAEDDRIFGGATVCPQVCPREATTARHPRGEHQSRTPSFRALGWCGMAEAPSGCAF